MYVVLINSLFSVYWMIFFIFILSTWLTDVKLYCWLTYTMALTPRQ